MSALTKLFVVLLVICSLLVSASVIVFVNRVEDFKAQADATALRLKSEQAAHEAANAQISALTGQLTQAQNLANTQEADFTKQNDADKAQNASLNAQIVDLQNKNAEQAVEASRLTSTLQAAQDENKAQAQTIADVRKADDDLRSKQFELNTLASDLSSKNMAMSRQLEYGQEHENDLQKQVDYLKQVIQKNGIQMNATASSALPPLTPVKGTVKGVNRIDGNLYATLDVGSSESVGKGMLFYAYNHDTGDFLGSITIDKVDPDESIGIIKGPRINDVKQGTEVATQIQ